MLAYGPNLRRRRRRGHRLVGRCPVKVPVGVPTAMGGLATAATPVAARVGTERVLRLDGVGGQQPLCHHLAIDEEDHEGHRLDEKNGNL